jgi:hypothetical protein
VSTDAFGEQLPPIEAYSTDVGSRPERKRPLPFLRGEDFSAMTPRLDSPGIVKGLLPSESLIAIIGPSGSGKTFWGTDLGCHVASDLQYRKRRTTSGLVIYGALEGAGSARNRFYAWRQNRLRDRSASLPLRAMIDPINLRDPSDALRMVEFIRAAESDYEKKVALCFIDTLSRAMAGGNENAPDDMGALIDGADAIRRNTGASVVLIHHLGKDETRGARGHNSLYAALDTEITIRVAGAERVAKVTKQRDWPSGDEFAFRLETVEIGRDVDGDAVTSCVVVHSDKLPDARKQPSGKNQIALLAALSEWHRANAGKVLISGLELREIAKTQDIDKKRLPECIEGLEKAGWLQPCTGGHKFIPE